MSGPGPVSDDFDRTNLDLGVWTFSNPLGVGQAAMIGAGTGDAHLALSVPAGTAHNAWGGTGNETVRVMQACADADFEVVVKFNGEPTDGYNDQGIIVEQDASNWLRFDVFHTGSDYRAFIGRTIGGSNSSALNASITLGTASYLRVTRTGDDFDFDYSNDGSSWTHAGSVNQALTVASCGVFAGNPIDALAFTAEVDYFFNTAAPISPEDGGAPADTDSPLIHSIVATPGLNQLTVDWFTDEPCTGSVEYGETPAFELGTVSDAGGLRDHSVLLTGLQTGVTYHYRVSSDDGTNPPSTSAADTVFLDPTGPLIDVWYGLDQTFGTIGLPQPWVNVLGHVSDPDGVTELSYRLNGGDPVELTIGPDGRRLENAGDFNVDLLFEDLDAGANSVEITAVDGAMNQSVRTVTVNYDTGNVWPLPYTVDWSTVSEIADESQIIDGKWSLEGIGVRTTEPGYDRLIGIGNRSWDDYQVEVPITMNSLSPSSGGVGILLRWDGHTDNPVAGTQPKSGYLPLGCIGWYRNGRVELYGNGGQILDTDPRVLTNGLTYNFKMQVETNVGVGAIYRLKVWEDGMSEPVAWDVEGQETLADPQRGSMMLISHEYDATFGDVTITPLTGAPNVAPVAAADLLYVSPAGEASVAILANDTDSDGNIVENTVTVTQAPANGTLFVNPTTGLATYTHDGSATTTDEFRYTVEDNDGALSNEAIVSISITTDPPQAFDSDDFDCGFDSSKWTFINPLAAGTIDIVDVPGEGAHLELSVPNGTPHDAWGAGGVNEGVRIMQAAQNVDFEVTAKWEAEPTDGFNDQGIVIEEDADNWLRFDVYHTGTQLKAFIGARIGGSNTTVLNATITPGTANWIRVTRTGNNYAFELSNDGVSWSTASNTTQPVLVSSVGVFAANPVAGLDFTSRLDFFFEADSAISPEDDGSCDESFCGPTVGKPSISGPASSSAGFTITPGGLVGPACSGSPLLMFGSCATSPIVIPSAIGCGTCPLGIGEVWGVASSIVIGPGDLSPPLTFCVQTGCFAPPMGDPACINLSDTLEVTLVP